MSWIFMGLGTITNNGQTNPTFSLPAGLTLCPNDAILIPGRIFNVSSTVPTPQSGASNYAIIDQSWLYQRFFGRYASGASEPAPTINSTAGFLTVALAVFRWIGVGSPPPMSSIVDTSSANGTGSTTNYPYNLLPQPASNGSLCVAIASSSASSTSIADSSSYPNRLDQQSNNGSGNGGHTMSTIWDYLIQGTAAAIASGSFVVSGGSSVNSVSLVVALKPGSPPPTTCNVGMSGNVPSVVGATNYIVSPLTA